MKKFRQALIVAAVLALSTPAVAAPRSVASNGKPSASKQSGVTEPTLLQRVLRRIRPLGDPTPPDPAPPEIRTTGPIG